MRHGMSEGRKFAGLLICCGRRAIQNEQSLFEKENIMRREGVGGNRGGRKVLPGISTLGIPPPFISQGEYN